MRYQVPITAVMTRQVEQCFGREHILKIFRRAEEIFRRNEINLNFPVRFGKPFIFESLVNFETSYDGQALYEKIRYRVGCFDWDDLNGLYNANQLDLAHGSTYGAPGKGHEILVGFFMLPTFLRKTWFGFASPRVRVALIDLSWLETLQKQAIITAHEIAHLFSAQHIDVRGMLMYSRPALKTKWYFSKKSKPKDYCTRSYYGEIIDVDNKRFIRAALNTARPPRGNSTEPMILYPHEF